MFIAGGTGFVGTWLTEAFAWANRRLGLGASAVLLSRDPARFIAREPHLGSDDAIRFVAGDAATFVSPPGTFRYVIHAVSERPVAPTPERPAATLDADIAVTRRMLDFAYAAGAERFLFTSSGSAYGSQSPDVYGIPETTPTAPLTTDINASYGHGKRLSEFLCALYAEQSRLMTPIARLFAFVGPHFPLDPHYAISSFLADTLAGRPIAIGGDGTPYRSYLYASDLARWLWTILVQGESARIYNVGSGEAISIRELAQLVAETLASETRISIARPPVPGAPAARYVPSVERAGNELGLRPTVPLREGIRRMADWYTGLRRAG